MKNTKTLLTCVMGVLLAGVMFVSPVMSSASMTNVILYQGRLTDALGQPVADGDYQLTFRILNDSLTGTELWSETYTAVPVSDGMVSVALGGTNPIPLDILSATDATGQPLPLFLEVQVGSDTPIRPRARLGGSPFAGQAARLRGDVSTAPGELTIVDTTLNDTLLLSVKHLDKASPKLAEALCRPSGDTSRIEVFVDSTKATMKGNKKTTNDGVDSFFDITASDSRSGITVGQAPLGTNDSDLVVIKVDSTGSSISMKKKGDIKDIVIVIINDNKDVVPNANIEILPGNTEAIAITADSGKGAGVDISTAKKVVKFRAGADLATTVKRINPLDTLKEGAYIALTGALDRFVDITVDSLTSSLVFGDTLGDTLFHITYDKASPKIMDFGSSITNGVGDTSSIEMTVDTNTATMTLKKKAKRGHGHLTPDTLIYLDTTNQHNMGRLVVDSNGVSLTLSQSGGGLPSTQAMIADVDADGDLDMTVAGDVGIGTATPSNILTVQQGSATDPIADAWTTYSSRRWKKNIQPIRGALGMVKRLRGVTFDWKKNDKHDIGLIAEEVGEVVPEVVAYEENGVDAKSVDYARLVAVLIQAVKEQQSQIDEQQAQITRLSKSNERLADRLAQIEASKSSRVHSETVSSGNCVASSSR